ncbi:unnamed protein product, partial [Darwinula stevensoni]
LAAELICRDSTTPNDAACQQVIAARLEKMGFTCQTLYFGEGDALVENLWAYKKGADPAGKVLVFAGHTDVVPTGPLEQWTTPPFVPTVRDERLYGRGAADMKSSLAAFVVASEQFVLAYPNHQGSIAFLLTSDEEGPSIHGTVKVCDWLVEKNQNLNYCIVGEPTSVKQMGDMIKNGRRGSLSGKLKIIGKQGHIAYPHLADNPIHAVAPALAELANTVWDQGNDYFPPTTWQISNFHSGTGAGNVIPGQATIDFNFRFASCSTAEDLQARLCRVLDRYKLTYQIDWVLGAKPFLTGEGELIGAMRESIQKHLGVTTELSTTGGTSDGRFIAQICEQVVEFGPINASIHQIDEHIARTGVADMLTAEHLLLEPPSHLLTLGDWVRFANSLFIREKIVYGQGTDNAYDEAVWLVMRTLALDFDQLERFWDNRLADGEQYYLYELLKKRVLKRKPTAYLLKEAWLAGQTFYVDERVIIPRSYLAELMHEEALLPWLPELDEVSNVLELCTGSGCLAIMAAQYYGQALVDAVDISEEALAVAKINVNDYDLTDRVILLQGDLYAPLYDPALPPSRLYDLILCNPPYVNHESMNHLPPEFLHEPRLALDGGADGMALIDTILRKASHFLKPEGILVIELGHERHFFEMRYPNLNPVWLSCAHHDDALPLYLGLIVAQMVYVFHFWVELVHLVQAAFGDQQAIKLVICAVQSGNSICAPNAPPPLSPLHLTETLIMLVVLGLIDVVMISNLLIMVIVGGYETFVSRMYLEEHPDQPEWLSHVNATVLKVKLATAIIGISSVHLLKTFINADSMETKTIVAQTVIHVVFILSAMAIAATDWILTKTAHQAEKS